MLLHFISKRDSILKEYLGFKKCPEFSIEREQPPRIGESIHLLQGVCKIVDVVYAEDMRTAKIYVKNKC